MGERRGGWGGGGAGFNPEILSVGEVLTFLVTVLFVTFFTG